MIGGGAADPPLGFRFEPIAPLGRGASGVVWRCRDPEHGEIAVKVIAPELGELARERLRREHHVLASVRHPNVVQVLELYEEPHLALGMELVQGEDLLAALGHGELATGRCEPLRMERLVALLQQLLDGIAAVHAAGLVHRDVKPDNARVTPQGTVKLLDLGLAGVAATDTVGTLRYMAPEVLAGHGAEPRSDLYAVGLIAFEALLGDVPFADRDTAAARLNLDPPLPHELDPAIPEGLSRTIHRLLRRSPSDRPASATAAAAAFTTDDAVVAVTTNPGAADPADATATARVAVSEPHLCGRTAALELLDAGAASARRGDRPGAIAIVGSPGLGRSRLLASWSQQQRSHLVLPLSGRDETQPLQAFATVVDELAIALAGLDPMDGLGLLPPTARALSTLSRRALSLPGIDLLPEPPPLTEREAETRIADAIGQLLSRLSRQRRVLLIADDVAGCGPASQDLLRRLATDPESRLLLVSSWLAPATPTNDLCRDGLVTLEPLTATDIAQLATSALPQPPTGELTAWLVQTSGGSPQRAIDALFAAERRGALAITTDGRVTLRTPARTADAAGNANASDDGSMLDELDADARKVATALAVLQRPAPLGQIQTVAAMRPQPTARALQALLRCQLVREELSGIRLRSDDLRQVLLGPIDATTLVQLHRRAAKVAEAAGQTLAAVDHRIAAGDIGRTLAVLPELLDQLLRGGQPARVVSWSSAALEHLADRRRQQALRAQLFAIRSRAQGALGYRDQRNHDIAAARKLLPGTDAGSAIDRAVVLAEWEAAMTDQRLDALLPRIDAFVAAATDRGDRANVAFAYERLMSIYTGTGDLDLAESHGDQALSLQLALRLHDLLPHTLNALGIVDLKRGRDQAALHRFRRARRLCRILSMARLECLVVQNMAGALDAVGHPHEALNALREALPLAGRIGEPVRESALAVSIVVRLSQLVHMGEAGTLLERASRTLAGTGHIQELAGLPLAQGLYYLRLGLPVEAEAAARRLLANLDGLRLGEFYLSKAWLFLAEALRNQGKTAEAAEAIAQAREQGLRQGLNWTEADCDLLDALLALDAGDDDRAASLGQRSMADAEQRRDHTVAARAACVVAKVTGRADRVERAIALAIDASDPIVELEARGIKLEQLRRDNRHDEARDELERGRKLFDRLLARSGDARKAMLACPWARQWHNG